MLFVFLFVVISFELAYLFYKLSLYLHFPVQEFQTVE